MEEEEQLLNARMEEKQSSEEIQRVVQEEEKKLILQKGLLQRKLSQIISRCGLRGIGNDVECCLSMCVEELLRSFICKMIRLSKQRADVETKRHKLVVTSDVQQQVLTMNQKAEKEWEKKRAEESDKFRKVNNDLADVGTDVEKNKDERPKKRKNIQKVRQCHQKEDHKMQARKEDGKMRAKAANAATRAAIGVDDMLSKWQLMAKQAQKKRESMPSVSSSHQQDIITDENNSNFGENQNESGGMSRHSRRTGMLSNPKIDRTICLKDVIATLEKEPMMSRSIRLYHLYERATGDSGAG